MIWSSWGSLPLHPPFKFADAAFAVADLGGRDDSTAMSPVKLSRRRPPSLVLPGRLDLIPVVARDDAKAQLFGTVATLATGLGPSRGRPIERDGNAGLLNGIRWSA
jgi:hypothetical protein